MPDAPAPAATAARPFLDRLASFGRRFCAWAIRRAQERSTWIGLAGAATALGYSTIGQHLTSVADFVPMILGAGGLALASASTKPHA